MAGWKAMTTYGSALGCETPASRMVARANTRIADGAMPVTCAPKAATAPTPGAMRLMREPRGARSLCSLDDLLMASRVLRAAIEHSTKAGNLAALVARTS